MVERILVVKLDGIGDVVLATPFLRELRANYPQARITMVTAPAASLLVRNCPYINEIKVYDHKRGRGDRFNAQRGLNPVTERKGGGIKSRFEALLELFRFLVRELKGRYDLTIVPRWATDCYRAGWIVLFSRATRRITYAEQCALGTPNKPWRNRLYTDIITTATAVHERDINLELIGHLGGTVENSALELWPSQDDENKVDDILRTVRGDGAFICICPGSIMPEKEWALDNYQKLINRILDGHDVDVVLIGGPSEKTLGDDLASRFCARVFNMVGVTSLNETAVLLKKSLLYVGNDTGAMHMAVAMETPVVMISCFPKDGHPRDLNSPARFGPCPEVSSIVLQAEKALPPCNKQCSAEKSHCINQVTVEEAFDAVDQMLSGATAKTAKQVRKPTVGQTL